MWEKPSRARTLLWNDRLSAEIETTLHKGALQILKSPQPNPVFPHFLFIFDPVLFF